MAAVVTLSLLCVFVSPIWTAPTKTFDQRQQGELNIHAQLDNIVVVVIPSARLNLLELASDTKLSGEKGGFLQLLQKLQKEEIDRYETVKDEEDSLSNLSTGQFEIDARRPIPVITSSQQVSLSHNEKNGEKEEEVVATVEEMKPETTEKTIEPPKSEATEDSPVKEQSTVSEVVQDSVLTVSVPDELKDAVQDAEKKIKESSHDAEKETKQTVQQKEDVKVPNEVEKKEDEKIESLEKETPKPLKNEEVSKSYKPEVTATELPKKDEPTIEDYIKPLAAKEEITPDSSFSRKTPTHEEHPVSKKPIEPVRLQEGVRKEKVIRYKPEAKWAPELVDLLGPPRPKPKELQERQMFRDLCSPGIWDPELRTCIMPGETRSKSELARFLDAMRFGITIPK